MKPAPPPDHMSFSEFKRKYQHHYLKTKAETKDRISKQVSPKWVRENYPEVYRAILRERLLTNSALALAAGL